MECLPIKNTEILVKRGTCVISKITLFSPSSKYINYEVVKGKHLNQNGILSITSLIEIV